MNSKERVLAAVNLEKTDYVPSDFHATPVVLERLYKHFGIDNVKNLLKILGTDMVDIRGIIDPLWIGKTPPAVVLEDGTKQNYLGFQTKKFNTVFGEVEEHSGFIFENEEEIEKIENFNWPKADWFDFTNISKQLDEYKDYAIMASGASVFQHATLVRGMNNLLCDMIISPEIAILIMDKYTGFYIDYFEKMFIETKGRIDILRVADDLGMQDRQMVSLELFKKYVKPRLKKLVDMAHSYGVKLMFHSCGSINEYIEDLIEIGVDILDPIQTRAKGMEPEMLKKKFGGRICFHGSVDTQYTLPKGNSEEIKKEVKERLEVLGQAGGFIIAPSHTVQPDVSIENIITLYESIRLYR